MLLRYLSCRHLSSTVAKRRMRAACRVLAQCLILTERQEIVDCGCLLDTEFRGINAC